MKNKSQKWTTSSTSTTKKMKSLTQNKKQNLWLDICRYLTLEFDPNDDVWLAFTCSNGIGFVFFSFRLLFCSVLLVFWKNNNQNMKWSNVSKREEKNILVFHTIAKINPECYIPIQSQSTCTFEMINHWSHN